MLGTKGGQWGEGIIWGGTKEPLTTPFPQALPYVALLIAMIFFIYAVIGMQVRDTCVCVCVCVCVCARDTRVCGWGSHSTPSCVCITHSPTDLWEGGPAGRDPDQPQQQLPDLPPGRAAALQVGLGSYRVTLRVWGSLRGSVGSLGPIGSL